jgi:PhnB protein
MVRDPSNLSYVRHRAGAVRPYVHGPVSLWDFVQEVFGAEEIERHAFGPTSCHIEARIADSVIVLETGDPPHPQGTPSSVYVYVPDVDSAYHLALEMGAAAVSEPSDKPYQERQAGVRDTFGNLWWIATFRG